MLIDYGKVWYDDKAIENILSLTNFSINIGSLMTHTKMMISLFMPIQV